MRALLVNDTSGWHRGSMECVSKITLDLVDQGYDVDRVPTHGDIDDGFPELVVVNGEGTMHDDDISGAARWVLRTIRDAKDAGSRVWLVNALWCRMSDEAARIVDECCDYVQVREPLSRRDAIRQGIQPALRLDAAVSQTFDAPDWRPIHFNDDTWRIKRGDWTLQLHGCSLLNTCYHHGVLAALAVKTPFIYREPRNATHKVDGLLAWLQMPRPTHENVDQIDWRGVWRRFDRLPRFALPAAVCEEVPK